jgi:hypothetical protein
MILFVIKWMTIVVIPVKPTKTWIMMTMIITMVNLTMGLQWLKKAILQIMFAQKMILIVKINKIIMSLYLKMIRILQMTIMIMLKTVVYQTGIMEFWAIFQLKLALEFSFLMKALIEQCSNSAYQMILFVIKWMTIVVIQVKMIMTLQMMTMTKPKVNTQTMISEAGLEFSIGDFYISY